MKSKILFICLFVFCILISAIPSVAQKSHNNDCIIVKIKPSKKVFFKNDYAFFVLRFRNISDSIINIPWKPEIDSTEISCDEKQTHYSIDILVNLLKMDSNNIYQPYYWSIDIDYLGPISINIDSDSVIIPQKTVEDAKMPKNISLNKNETVNLVINLFPYLIDMESGAYKGRVCFIASKYNNCKDIYSNWVKFKIMN